MLSVWIITNLWFISLVLGHWVARLVFLSILWLRRPNIILVFAVTQYDITICCYSTSNYYLLLLNIILLFAVTQHYITICCVQPFSIMAFSISARSTALKKTTVARLAYLSVRSLPLTLACPGLVWKWRFSLTAATFFVSKLSGSFWACTRCAPAARSLLGHSHILPRHAVCCHIKSTVPRTIFTWHRAVKAEVLRTWRTTAPSVMSASSSEEFIFSEKSMHFCFHYCQIRYPARPIDTDDNPWVHSLFLSENKMPLIQTDCNRLCYNWGG